MIFPKKTYINHILTIYQPYIHHMLTILLGKIFINSDPAERPPRLRQQLKQRDTAIVQLQVTGSPREPSGALGSPREPLVSVTESGPSRGISWSKKTLGDSYWLVVWLPSILFSH